MKICSIATCIALIVGLTACTKPTALFRVVEEKKVAAAKIQFENKSSKATEYFWEFGDGNTSREFAPSHEYRASGQYTVSLKASKGKKVSTHTSKITVEQPSDCMVEIETEYGNMTLLLYNATPLHRDNFIKLAEEGFFNDLLFHRVINGFMIQGGDPTSRNASPGAALGTGGPGYQIPAEFVDSLVHFKGALAAARTGDAVNPKKESSGSQFYIVHGRPVSPQQLEQTEAQKNMHYAPDQKKIYEELGGSPMLDREYTVFGKVIKGLEVIDKIAAVPTLAGNRPSQDVKMKIRVIK